MPRSRYINRFDRVSRSQEAYQEASLPTDLTGDSDLKGLVKRGAQGGDQEACQEAGISTDLTGDLDHKRHVERQVYQQI